MKTMPPFAAETAACRAAQLAWAARPVRDRLRPVRALRHLIADRADDLCAAVAADVARTRVEVIGSELLPTAAALKFLEQQAARILAPRTVGRAPLWLFGCRDVVHRRPRGVVGVIGTWNYPLFLNAVPIAHALAAGNGVVWKPSEFAPASAALTHRLFLEAGFPPDLFQLLPATREAGPEVAEAAVDHAVFTGSDAVGRKLAARLGERLVSSTMELSGCDAMFVLADADVAQAARAAWFGVVLNRGQTCIAVRRIFVARARYAEFVAAITPLVEASEPAALVTSAQTDHARRLVAEAVAKGAKRVSREPESAEASGKTSPNTTALGPKADARFPGVFEAPAVSAGTRIPGESGTQRCSANPPRPLPEAGRGGQPGLSPSPLRGGVAVPALLLSPTADLALCREACFAPVAAVVPFDTVEDALRVAAECPFGLAASVFTADVRAADELAARIPAGAVTVNDVVTPTAHPGTPFGGRGASGWGVTQGAEGLLAMTVPQAVTVHRGWFRPAIDDVLNPDPATPDILLGLLRATHARGWAARLAAFWQMVRAMRRRK